MTDGDLILTGSHWGTFRARVRNGRIAEIRPFEHDPKPTPMLHGLSQMYDHPTRIRRPAIRESWLTHGPGARPERRGRDPFVEIGWDEALTFVADASFAASAAA